MPTDKLQILTPIVTSVNGQSGDVKSAWYFNFTSSDSTADKTPAEIYAAYKAGYSIYAIISDATPQLIFPCLNATENTLAFSGSRVMDGALIVYTLIWDNTKWNLSWFDQEESLNQKYVSYNAQGMGDASKQQARENIDAEQLYHGLTPSSYYVNDFYGTQTIYIEKGAVNLPVAEITDTELLKAVRSLYVYYTGIYISGAKSSAINMARLVKAGIITVPYQDRVSPYNSIISRYVEYADVNKTKIYYKFNTEKMNFSIIVNLDSLEITNINSYYTNIQTNGDDQTIPQQYVMAANPTTDMQIATKKYVDDAAPQPDWNQHDSTQKDYVKNRIAYKDAIVTDETETLLISGTMGTNVSIERSQALQYGKTYHVTIGDDSFTKVPAYGDMGPCLTSGGNASDASYWAFITSGVTCSSSAGSDYTGKAYKIYEVVQQIEYDIKQLPEECLPDSAITVNNINDIAVVYDSAQDLTDEQKAQARENIDAQELICYEEEVAEEVIGTFSIGNGDKDITLTKALEEGKTYLVYANDVSTEQICKYNTEGKLTLAIYISGSPQGQVIQNSSNSWIVQGNNSYTSWTIKVAIPAHTNIVQIPEKYLPAQIATEEDIMDLLSELGAVSPITTSDCSILIANTNEIYSL